MKKYIAVGSGLLVISFAVQALPQEKVAYPILEEQIDTPGPSECDAFPGNLAANCGFETGMFAPWVQSGDTSFTGVTARSAASGRWGAEFGPVNSDGFITQNINTVAGETYSVSFKLRNAGRPNRMSVAWNGEVVYSLDQAGDFGFMWVSIGGLTATGSSSTLRFGFYNLPDWFFIDDIIVTICHP